MLAGLSSSQFDEWMQYAAVEPFGEERGDLRAGIVASVIANVHRRKNARAFRPSDFMPTFERKKMTWQQQMQVLKAGFTAWNEACTR